MAGWQTLLYRLAAGILKARSQGILIGTPANGAALSWRSPTRGAVWA